MVHPCIPPPPPTSCVVGSFPACSFFIDGKFTGFGTLTLRVFFSFGTAPRGVIVPILLDPFPPNLVLEFLFLLLDSISLALCVCVSSFVLCLQNVAPRLCIDLARRRPRTFGVLDKKGSLVPLNRRSIQLRSLVAWRAPAHSGKAHAREKL